MYVADLVSAPGTGAYPSSQLPNRGELISRVMKRTLELMHQKDANVRQVELTSIIREVAEEMVGKWVKASIPCWGVIYIYHKIY